MNFFANDEFTPKGGFPMQRTLLRGTLILSELNFKSIYLKSPVIVSNTKTNKHKIVLTLAKLMTINILE